MPFGFAFRCVWEGLLVQIDVHRTFVNGVALAAFAAERDLGLVVVDRQGGHAVFDRVVQKRVTDKSAPCVFEQQHQRVDCIIKFVLAQANYCIDWAVAAEEDFRDQRPIKPLLRRRGNLRFECRKICRSRHRQPRTFFGLDVGVEQPQQCLRGMVGNHH